MLDELLHFKWIRYPGYEIVTVPLCGLEDARFQGRPSQRINPTNETGTEYYPVRDFPYLFRSFANVRNTKDLLQFVRLYGPLLRWTKPPTLRFNEVDNLLEEAAWCRTVFALQTSGSLDRLQFPSIRIPAPRVVFGYDRALGLQTIVKPRDLLQVIKIQLLESCKSGEVSQKCKNCPKWFKKRSNARFCSSKCKDDFHNAEKRKARKISSELL